MGDVRVCRIGGGGGGDFVDNTIRTSKYTLKPWRVDFFVWKNLYEQFLRVANLYFLLISIFQLIPGLSPTGRYSTFLTLTFMLFCSAVKAGYEDWWRHKSDKAVNSRPAIILQAGKWASIAWGAVSVGHVLKVEKYEDIPADIVLISSSEAQGVAYVETSNLDGETNLKAKRALKETMEAVDESALSQIAGAIECEQPNCSLYTFNGNLRVTGQGAVVVGPDGVLLRGSQLRKSKFVTGVVVYTGTDTKVMQNAKDPPHKRSQVERNVNALLKYVLAFQLLLVCVCSAFLALSDVSGKWYLHWDPNQWLLFLVSLPTFLILFNNLIPISLYVSMEIVKAVQGIFINSDLCMYYEQRDMPAVARTTSLNEELGQINIVFSDKTGTLTCNVMKFFKFSVEGVAYGRGMTEIGKAAARRLNQPIADDRPLEVVKSSFPFWDPNMDDWQNGRAADGLREFFTLLSVCHTVITERNTNGELTYQAESPDDAALVEATAHFGFNFKGREAGGVCVVAVDEVEQRFIVKNVLEFNSDRKRMSVIVQTPDGHHVLYTKGADNVMWRRMATNTSDIVPKTVQHLEDFGNEGLRTLLCGRRELSVTTFEDWSRRYKTASEIIGATRDEQLNELAEEIERDLQLVGATAIEDKLQDGVPTAVESLRQASLNVWVLTGDKQETAINIGFACALLHSDMKQIILNQTDPSNLRGNLKVAAETYFKNPEPGVEVALVIDGACLAVTLEHPDLTDLFHHVATHCRSVVCCRVSPLQKADVVTLVRQRDRKAITLAIGDGANDVSMIQSAHVGVGISGMEGQQASNAADYAIGQFRYLQRLLFVHGRWDYRRMTRLISYSFYKNIVLYLTQFFFCLDNGFSGQSLYDQWVLSLYNVAFTSLPILVVGCLDRDVEHQSALLNNPKLYHVGLYNEEFTVRVFLGWITTAVLHAALCYGIPRFTCGGSLTPDGMAMGLDSNGVIIYTTVVIVVNLKIAVDVESWTTVHHITVWGSIVVWFLFLVIYGEMFTLSEPMYRLFLDLYGEPLYWLPVILTSMICFLPDWVMQYTSYNWGRPKKLYKQIRIAEHRGGVSDVVEMVESDGPPPTLPTTENPLRIAKRESNKEAWSDGTSS